MEAEPRSRPVLDVEAVEVEGATEAAVLRAAARWFEAVGSVVVLTLRWDDRVVYDGYDPEVDPRYVLTIYYER